MDPSLGPSSHGWAAPRVGSLKGPGVGYLQGCEGGAESWETLRGVTPQSRGCQVAPQSQGRKERGRTPEQTSLCTLAPKHRVTHQHAHTGHTPPLPREADDKTQGAKTTVAGGLIMASSLVVLYIDSALGEMC